MANFEMLSEDHPVVQGILKQNGIKPAKNGEPPVEVGSRQRLPEVTPQPEPIPEGKPIAITLQPAEEARAIREAHIRGVSVPEYLTSILNEKLRSNLGAPIIGKASFMGEKVNKVTGSVRRVTNAD